MLPKMSIYSRQDSRVLVFREESSAKQRDLCNLASQYSEPDDYAVTLSLVCGKREEFRPDEGRPRDGFADYGNCIVPAFAGATSCALIGASSMKSSLPDEL